MSKKNIIKPLALSTILGTTTMIVAGPAAGLYDANAMGFDVLGSGHEVRSELVASVDSQPNYLGHHEKSGDEGSCGEGKCGDESKGGDESKCGDEGSCGEKGEMGESEKHGSEGKCGEGKCGS